MWKDMLHYFVPFVVLALCCIYVPLEARADEPDSSNPDYKAESRSPIESAYPHTSRESGGDENGENIAPFNNFNNMDPEKTVDSLAAKANDWREPSKKSEEKYILAIRQWLDGLEPFQRERARQILREAHPDMRALRTAIREKKHELANLSFDHGTRPETLPRLGQELQALRKALRSKLDALGKRLRYEAGVSMGPLGGDGFWLVPQQPDQERKTPARKTPLKITPPQSDSQPGSPLAFLHSVAIFA